MSLTYNFDFATPAPLVYDFGKQSRIDYVNGYWVSTTGYTYVFSGYSYFTLRYATNPMGTWSTATVEITGAYRSSTGGNDIAGPGYPLRYNNGYYWYDYSGYTQTTGTQKGRWIVYSTSLAGPWSTYFAGVLDYVANYNFGGTSNVWFLDGYWYYISRSGSWNFGPEGAYPHVRNWELKRSSNPGGPFTTVQTVNDSYTAPFGSWYLEREVDLSYTYMYYDNGVYFAIRPDPANPSNLYRLQSSSSATGPWTIHQVTPWAPQLQISIQIQKTSDGKYYFLGGRYDGPANMYSLLWTEELDGLWTTVSLSGLSQGYFYYDDVMAPLAITYSEGLGAWFIATTNYRYRYGSVYYATSGTTPPPLVSRSSDATWTRIYDGSRMGTGIASAGEEVLYAPTIYSGGSAGVYRWEMSGNLPYLYSSFGFLLESTYEIATETTLPPMRLTERDDGKGFTQGHPRINTANVPYHTSVESGRIWQGQAGTYQ